MGRYSTRTTSLFH